MGGPAVREDDIRRQDVLQERVDERVESLDERFENIPELADPGQINLAETNPELFAELESIRGLRDRSRDAFQDLGVFDADRFSGRVRESQSRQAASDQNRLAALGLAGTSTAQGTIQEGGRRIEQQFSDRQLRELLSAVQTESALTGQVQGTILTGQGQFAGFQGQQLQRELALLQGELQLFGVESGLESQISNAIAETQAAQAQANSNIIGSLFGAAGTIAGGAFAGPVGAAAVGGATGVRSPEPLPKPPTRTFNSIDGSFVTPPTNPFELETSFIG